MNMARRSRRRRCATICVGVVASWGSPWAYCPQVHDPGVTAAVDWGEAKVIIAREPVTVRLFLMQSCFSGACFVMAFETQSQQALFEGHVAVFSFFSGVFGTLRYDNLKCEEDAEGRRRVENDRFVAFRSHYLYQACFTLVGLEGAHEKGCSSHCTSWWRGSPRCHARVRASVHLRPARRAGPRDAQPRPGRARRQHAIRLGELRRQGQPVVQRNALAAVRS